MRQLSLIYLALVACSPANEPPAGAPTPGLSPYPSEDAAQGRGKGAREAQALAGLDLTRLDLGQTPDAARARAAAAWLEKAYQHQAANEHLHALECFALAARGRQDAEVLAGLASGLSAVRRLQEARQVYGHALVLDPQHTQALAGRARLLFGLGLRQEAAGDYRALLALQPGDGVAHGALARQAFLAGELDTAREHARAALEQGADLPVRLMQAVGLGGAR